MLVINLFIDIAVNLQVGIACATAGATGGAVIRQVWEQLKPHLTDTRELPSSCRPRPDRSRIVSFDFSASAAAMGRRGHLRLRGSFAHLDRRSHKPHLTGASGDGLTLDVFEGVSGELDLYGLDGDGADGAVERAA